MANIPPPSLPKQGQQIREDYFLPRSPSEEDGDIISPPLPQPRGGDKDKRDRPPHLQNHPKLAKDKGEEQRGGNPFQGFTSQPKNHKGRKERELYVPSRARPPPSQSAKQESGSSIATSPPLQHEHRELISPSKHRIGRTIHHPIEITDSPSPVSNHANRAMSSSKRPAASRIEGVVSSSPPVKRQRYHPNHPPPPPHHDFSENEEHVAPGDLPLFQKYPFAMAPTVDASTMSDVEKEVFYGRYPQLRPRDVYGNVVKVRDKPSVVLLPTQGFDCQQQESAVEDCGADDVDEAAGFVVPEDKEELERMQRMIQQQLDRSKQMKGPTQQQPQRTPHSAAVSNKPSPPRPLSDKESRRQQYHEAQLQAKRHMRIEHGHGPQRRSRSPSSYISPPHGDIYAQRALPDIHNNPRLIDNIRAMSEEADTQHQTSQHPMNRAPFEALSRAPSVGVTDRPGNPVARELSSGRPTTEYGGRRMMSIGSGMSGGGGRYPSDNWKAYGEDGYDRDDFRGGAVQRSVMQPHRGGQYDDDMRASSDSYDQQQRFDDDRRFYPQARPQQDGLHDRYMQQRPQAHNRMHNFGQDQRSPSGYDQFDDDPYGNAVPAYGRDMPNGQSQRLPPAHVRHDDHGEPQRLHSFGSHVRMRREQDYDPRQFSGGSMKRQPQREYPPWTDERRPQRPAPGAQRVTQSRREYDDPGRMDYHADDHGHHAYAARREPPPPERFQDDFSAPRPAQTKKHAVMNNAAGIPPHHPTSHPAPTAPLSARNETSARRKVPKKAAPKYTQPKGRCRGGSNASCRSNSQASLRPPGRDYDDPPPSRYPAPGPSHQAHPQHHFDGKSMSQNSGEQNKRNISDSSTTSSGNSKQSHPSNSSKSRTSVDPTSQSQSPARHTQTQTLSPQKSTTRRRISLPFRTPTPIQSLPQHQKSSAPHNRQPTCAKIFQDWDDPQEGEDNDNYYQTILSRPPKPISNKPLRTQRETIREHPYSIPPPFSGTTAVKGAQIPSSLFGLRKSLNAQMPERDGLREDGEDEWERMNFLGVHGRDGDGRRSNDGGYGSGGAGNDVEGCGNIKGGRKKKTKAKKTFVGRDDSSEWSSSDFSNEVELARFRAGKLGGNAAAGKKKGPLQSMVMQDPGLMAHLMPLAVPPTPQSHIRETQRDKPETQAAGDDVVKNDEDVEMGGTSTVAQASALPVPNNNQPPSQKASAPRPESTIFPSKLDNIPNLEPPKASPFEGRKPIDFNAGRKKKACGSALNGIFGALDHGDKSSETQAACNVASPAQAQTETTITPQDPQPTQPAPTPQASTQPKPNDKPLSATQAAAERKRAKAEAIRAKLAEKGVISTAAKARALREGRALEEGYKLRSPQEIAQEEAASRAHGKGKEKEVPGQDLSSQENQAEQGIPAQAENVDDIDALFEDPAEAATNAAPAPSVDQKPKNLQADAAKTSKPQTETAGKTQKAGFDTSRYDLAERNANNQEERDAIRDLRDRKLAEHQLKTQQSLAKKDVERSAKTPSEHRNADVEAEKCKKRPKEETLRRMNEHTPTPVTPKEPNTAKVVATPMPKKKPAARALKKTPKSAAKERKAREEAAKNGEEARKPEDVEMEDAFSDDKQEEERTTRVEVEDGSQKTKTAAKAARKATAATPSTPSRKDDHKLENALRGLTEVELVQLHRTAGNVERLLALQEAGGHAKQDAAQQTALLKLVPDLVRELRDVKTEIARVQLYTSDGDPARRTLERRSKAGRPPLSSYTENAKVLTARERRERDLKNSRDFLIAEKAYLKRASEKQAKPGVVPKSEEILKVEKQAHYDKWWKVRKERDAEADKRAEENERKSLGLPNEPGMPRGKGAAGGIMGRLRESNKEAGMGRIDRTAGMPNAFDDLSGTEDDEESEEDGGFAERPKRGMKTVPGGRQRGTMTDVQIRDTEQRPVAGWKAYVVTARTTRYTWIHFPATDAVQPEPPQALGDANVDFEAETEAEFEKAVEDGNPRPEAQPAGGPENGGLSIQAIPKMAEEDDLFGDPSLPSQTQERSSPPPESAADMPPAAPSVPAQPEQLTPPPVRVIESVSHLIVSICFVLSAANQAAAEHILAVSTSEEQSAEERAGNEATLKEHVLECNDKEQTLATDIEGEDFDLRVEVVEKVVSGG